MIGNARGYLQKHVFLRNRDDFRTVPIILEYDDNDHILSPVMAEDFRMMLIIIEYDVFLAMMILSPVMAEDFRMMPMSSRVAQGDTAVLKCLAPR